MVCSIDGWITATSRPAAVDEAGRASACAPKPSVAASRSAAAAAPGHARRGPRASRPAMPAFTATITSDTA